MNKKTNLEISNPLTDTTNKSKRITINTMMLYFRMIITMVVALYTSRVVLNTLGIEDFGIYNITGGVVMMFAFFNSAMTSATQRFLSFAIGKGDLIELKKVFNATQTIHFFLGVIIFFLAETLGLWFVETRIVIPHDRMNAAIWVYHFSVLTFIVSIIQVPYDALIIAHEKMKVYAYVSILEVFLKLIIVFLLMWISFDKLKAYGVLIFVVVFIITLVFILYTRINFRESKFEIVRDKKMYNTLIKYSGWNLFGNIAFMTKVQGVNIILNIFFGPLINSAQAIANQVQAAVQGFVSNFQLAVNPQIVKSFANDEKEYLTSLIFRGSKFSFYLMYLLSLPIILEGKQILVFWLKSVPEYTFIFTTLTLVVILITCITGPLTTSIQATGKIANYQTIVGTLQIFILPISFVLLKLTNYPIIPLLVTICIETIALFICIYFSSKAVGFSIFEFIKEIFFKNLLIVILTFPILILIRDSIEPSFLRLILIGIISFALTAVVMYGFGLSKSERFIVKEAIKKMLKSILYR